MTLDSLRESSLVQLEQYLNSNPYREYSMHKPYFPKTYLSVPQSHRSLGQPNPSLTAYQELMDVHKDPIALDRLAYKLRMKSDLNIDTLRETHARRRHRHHHPHTMRHQTVANSNTSDTLSSVPASVSTKTYGRQPTAITMSTNITKTLNNDDLTGIEGNAVRVGTIDDLIKQFRRAEFRLVRRPAEYLDNASTQLSSDLSTNDRTVLGRPHYHQERPVKHPQALTEYRFNAPTFPSTPTQPCRDPSFHQGLIYQYRTRERIHQPDLPLLPNRPLITSEPHRQRMNSLVIQDRQPASMGSRDKRIQELREKSLMRTEKQVCVCNKLTIVDPFNSNGEHSQPANFPQLHPAPAHQPPPSVQYFFPPVRPFGYFTKKPAANADDSHQGVWTPPPALQRKKLRAKKKKVGKLSKNSLDSLDKIAHDETLNDDEDSQIFNDTIQSMISLNDLDEEPHNTTIDVHLNLNDTLITAVDDQDESWVVGVEDIHFDCTYSIRKTRQCERKKRCHFQF